MIASTPAALNVSRLRRASCEGRPLDPRVVVDRAATRLSARDHDLTAVFLKDACRRRVGVREHGVGHATEEQGHPRPLRSNGGQNLGQAGVGTAQLRQHRLHAPEGRRQQAEEPHSFGPVKETDPLQQPRRRQRELDPAGVRKQVMENQPLEQAGLLAPGRRALRARS